MLTLVLVGAALCGGCHRGSSVAGKSGVLRYPMPLEPLTLDPARLDETPTLELLQNVYEGLVMFDVNSRVVPQLAVRWENSSDHLTYTFHLRKGVRFHNGRTLTAEDLKYSLTRALRPETKSGVSMNYLGGIVGAKEVADGKRKDLPGVKALDESTLSITLDKPRGYFLGALAYPTGWVVCKEAIAANGGILDERSGVGTGPFKLADYRHGSKFTLTANPDYWGGKPPLDRIERPIVKDPMVAHIKYETGEVDMAGIPAEEFERDKANPKLKSEIHVMPSTVVFFLTMHPRLQPVFRNVKVRQAIGRSIDRDEIIRVASHGLWTRADTFLSPAMPGYDPNAAKIPYDPASARTLLAQAGYRDGKGFPTLTLVYTQSASAVSTVAQVMRDEIQRNLGIKVDLMERDGATLRTELLTQKVAFTVGDWGADYLDPQNFLSMLLRSGAPLNFFGYSNARFDALCDRADAESDMAIRIPLYRQADKIAMEEVALFPLMYGTARFLVKPYVRDWSRNAMSFLPHFRTRIER